MEAIGASPLLDANFASSFPFTPTKSGERRAGGAGRAESLSEGGLERLLVADVVMY